MRIDSGVEYTVEAQTEEGGTEEVSVFVVGVMRSYEAYDDDEGWIGDSEQYVMYTTTYTDDMYAGPYETEELDEFLASLID